MPVQSGGAVTCFVRFNSFLWEGPNTGTYAYALRVTEIDPKPGALGVGATILRLGLLRYIAAGSSSRWSRVFEALGKPLRISIKAFSACVSQGNIDRKEAARLRARKEPEAPSRMCQTHIGNPCRCPLKDRRLRR